MPDWLARRAALSPEALALAVDGERITFAELERRAQAAAAGLARLGVGPGDRVAVLAAAGWPYVALLFGAIRRRAILVPLNTRLAPAEIAWQLDDAGAGWLLYDETTVERAHAAAAGSAGVRRLPLTEALAGEPTTGAVPPIELARLHAIVYTSGTTGRPKGAMLTYGNHWWSAIASMLNLGLRADDRWLICLPLFHVGGMSILFRSVIGGFGSVLHASFQPDAVNRAIDEGVTIVSVVSVMLSRMLAARSGRPYPAWFRCALTGGGPVPAELLEACVRAAIPVVQTYGLTETASQVATLSPADAERKRGSAGKPLFVNDLEIRRPDGSVAPPGEVGEIVVRGPSVMAGYWNRPKETAAALREGWLFTGDLGYTDEEGFLYVVERRDDLIISGGENVYPAEVEAVLASHPDVAAACVCGIPDPRWGQVPVAAVQCRPGRTVDPGALIAYCRDRLAAYKVPLQVRLVESLPRTASGKLSRHAVRRWFDGG